MAFVPPASTCLARVIRETPTADTTTTIRRQAMSDTQDLSEAFAAALAELSGPTPPHRYPYDYETVGFTLEIPTDTTR
jgi:hypothetical protein